jgi:hypothetical protein
VGTKEITSASERGDERKRRKMASGGSGLDEKDENDRGKDGTKKKEERKNNVIITGIEETRGNIEKGVEEWLEREIGVKVNVKEAFKVNKDKMMLAKIESWEQKNIMVNMSKLKERKGERMFRDDDLTNEERKTQNKLREVAREEREIEDKG